MWRLISRFPASFILFCLASMVIWSFAQYRGITGATAGLLGETKCKQCRVT